MSIYTNVKGAMGRLLTTKLKPMVMTVAAEMIGLALFDHMNMVTTEN